MRKKNVITGMLISVVIFSNIILNAVEKGDAGGGATNLCDVTATYIAPWNGYCKTPGEQFAIDSEIFYNTIYSENENNFLTKLSNNKLWSENKIKELKEIIDTRKNFLKRLFITLGHFGVNMIDSKLKVIKKGKKEEKKLTKEEIAKAEAEAEKLIDIEKTLTDSEETALLLDEQDDPTHNWPYPLASIFGHGGRLIIEINTEADQKFTARNFLNLLITGKEFSSGPADVLKQRSAGSHGISYETVNNRLIAMEVKVQLNVFRHLANKGRHWGFNIPLGGIGNLDPFGKIIGPNGTRYEPETLNAPATKEVKDIDNLGRLGISKGFFYSFFHSLSVSKKYNYQHGHFYIFMRDYSQGIRKKKHVRSIIMIGLEACEPSGTNMWGHVHTWLSAFNTPKEPGVTGGKKWKQFKIENEEMKIPATYGGRRVFIDSTKKIKGLEELFQSILTADEPSQKAFFKALLGSSSSQAKNVFKNY